MREIMSCEVDNAAAITTCVKVARAPRSLTELCARVTLKKHPGCHALSVLPDELMKYRDCRRPRDSCCPYCGGSIRRICRAMGGPDANPIGDFLAGTHEPECIGHCGVLGYYNICEGCDARFFVCGRCSRDEPGVEYLCQLIRHTGYSFCVHGRDNCRDCTYNTVPGRSMRDLESLRICIPRGRITTDLRVYWRCLKCDRVYMCMNIKSCFAKKGGA